MRRTRHTGIHERTAAGPRRHHESRILTLAKHVGARARAPLRGRRSEKPRRLKQCLIAEEERAVASPLPRGRVQLTETDRIAAEREHDAIERIAGLDATDGGAPTTRRNAGARAGRRGTRCRRTRDTRPPVVTDFATMAAQRPAERRRRCCRARLNSNENGAGHLPKPSLSRGPNTVSSTGTLCTFAVGR